ncbi:DNA-binding transcriptional regulator, AcrR family [Parafrankia irregularis]|uniref:DNA-binding transcriptional regulator, AcrR family n=1 Tax=Parafrankia irregularis TaxID=795642 RepID=A0A0S4QKA8_9ACTN|nr:TetR/AcrR family transcriptional regulator [Parafrankia irregularis]CUU56033.1 DNA-binding transcriptional regulator, AcrR family [Parafrankia irregularis]
MAKLREAQKRLTRQLLLRAGLEQFQAKGYAATTVDDIANAAGTTRVTFYAYFPSRGALMKALIDEQLNEALARERSSEHGSTAHDLVATVAAGTREAIDAWVRRTVRSWPDIRPIIRIGRDAAVIEPALAHLVEKWMEEAISDVADGLTQADRFAPHQRHFKGVLAMAQLDYVAQNWGDADWKITREQMLDELVDSWVSLLV